MSDSSTSPSFVTSLTYKFLLLTTTSAAAFFCWLYVTKPTTIAAAPDLSPTQGKISTQDGSSMDESSSQESSTEDSAMSPTDFVAPSQDSLPGTRKPNSASSLSPVDPASRNNAIPLANTASTSGKPAWEETNDRVQHVITAQGNGSSERIILEVPVIYMTRGMRLGPREAEEARRILRAMEIYQDRINKLEQDGENIAKAWNTLLMNSQPVEALRADSPSLPQIKQQSPTTLKENSAATLSIDEE